MKSINSRRTILAGTLFLGVAVFFSGCFFRKSQEYKGRGYVVTRPNGWEEGEPLNKPFFEVSEEQPEIVTFNSPEPRKRYEDPEATITIYTQKFDRPLWVEDITGEISQWIRSKGYTILGEGKINYEGSIGYSANYYDARTDTVYLDFYFASDAKIFLVVTYATKKKLFKKYIEDFEAFRNSIEFRVSIF